MRSSDPRAGLRWTLPVFTSLAGYRRAWLARDLVAGVLVVALAIPLSMGMAEVAGMPPIAGLYSCVLPLVAYALFGSSPQLVVALDASTAALVATAVAPLAAGDPIRYGALAGLVALLVGVMLIAAACMRLGVVSEAAHASSVARLSGRPCARGGLQPAPSTAGTPGRALRNAAACVRDHHPRRRLERSDDAARRRGACRHRRSWPRLVRDSLPPCSRSSPRSSRSSSPAPPTSSS